MDPELQNLRYFVAVADAASFTAAARRCGVAQPSLSEGIRRLERVLRCRLFDRLPRAVRLTEAGRDLLPRAREALAAIDALRPALARHATEISGVLTLAASPTLAPYLAAPALAAFSRAHPHARATLREGSPDQLVALVKGGDADIALLGTPVDDQQLLVEPLFSESLLVALPGKHPLAGRVELSLADLAHEPLIVPDELSAFLPPRWQVREKPALRALGISPTTALALVQHRAGPCLLPASARPHTRGTLRFLPLRPTLARPVIALTHRDRSRPPTATAFLQTLRATLPLIL
jgi:LysR family hydrogen peroxide-inducible transcriptional activator